ncbi:KilA-N domain-containing protein [Ruminococcus sp. AM27-11LB]|jgi:hypothetical protein|uniref:KilA-N domain-containing protein n=1 Tax=Mediterraneibacter TaxID=2316020 RepID=UPI000E514F8A|nr:MULTISPECIES: KilA-N domain-containing protein [Mediterraneibacter]RGH91790.1 KilA-N domain-containing protein [Ruminococcus sp. AM27-27]RGH94736.1 KilA-N domain-containing protein [Ruminococcus sp. AM27-11LB]
MKNKVIEVQNVHISISKQKLDDYICITDIAKAKSDSVRAADVVRNWLRNRGTLEYLSVWEQIYNPNFKVFESEQFKKQAGLLTFTPSVSEWVNETNAIGLYVKRGKYGGTYAHKDIAFEFASAISPVFKLYLIKEFQRLKEEADILNVALFGFTAKAWREANPELAKKNNVRDFATINELTVLSNLESHNAQMLREGKEKGERFKILQEIAEYQLNVLNAAEEIKMIESDGALSEV